MRTIIRRTHATHHVWAIETGESKPRYLAHLDPRQFLRGYLSRWEARGALSTFKGLGICGPTARVVRVSVTVTTTGRG